MELDKLMINGKYLKINNKYIRSLGYFAYDGCHKIYVLESWEDVKMAMECGFYLYPIEKIRETYEDSCQLKFISSYDLEKYYVRQFETAIWTEVPASKKDIARVLNRKDR